MTVCFYLSRNATSRIENGCNYVLSVQVSEVKESKDTITQYTPIDEDEHKEVDRKANLNAARVFLYQGILSCFARKFMVFL